MKEAIKVIVPGTNKELLFATVGEAANYLECKASTVTQTIQREGTYKGFKIEKVVLSGTNGTKNGTKDGTNENSVQCNETTDEGKFYKFFTLHLKEAQKDLPNRVVLTNEWVESFKRDLASLLMKYELYELYGMVDYLLDSEFWRPQLNSLKPLLNPAFQNEYYYEGDSYNKVPFEDVLLEGINDMFGTNFSSHERIRRFLFEELTKEGKDRVINVIDCFPNRFSYEQECTDLISKLKT